MQQNMQQNSQLNTQQNSQLNTQQRIGPFKLSSTLKSQDVRISGNKAIA
jgi:hypothetical protein